VKRNLRGTVQPPLALRHRAGITTIIPALSPLATSAAVEKIRIDQTGQS
jgi:hypothetical protein